MTSKELYELLERLNMIEDYGECCEDDPTPAEHFENVVSKDLVSVINFVDELFLYNSEEYIKKFLICLFYNKGDDKDVIE